MNKDYSNFYINGYFLAESSLLKRVDSWNPITISAFNLKFRTCVAQFKFHHSLNIYQKEISKTKNS